MFRIELALLAPSLVCLAVELAGRPTAALDAECAPATVKADRCPTTVFAVAALATVKADRCPTTVFALAASATVKAD